MKENFIQIDCIYYFCVSNAEVAELVDAHDSKSCLREGVWVRFPPSVLKRGTVSSKNEQLRSHTSIR